ncbi:hypothetical protein E2C01_035157 [Portunus trituberculatus]|uniref:Uncharacterized protein n=1 Tax=Portunus trituberculatus TaxID=210409 RepID=A0A5B7F8L0_PORTR|nr:hypothetical protein [Portunus trituberculatus]
MTSTCRMSTTCTTTASTAAWTSGSPRKGLICQNCTSVETRQAMTSSVIRRLAEKSQEIRRESMMKSTMYRRASVLGDNPRAVTSTVRGPSASTRWTGQTTRSTAKICVFWPSCSWTTKHYILTWSPSCSTSCVKWTSRVLTWWAASPRRRSPPMATTWRVS